jgi:hypothetical protein
MWLEIFLTKLLNYIKFTKDSFRVVRQTKKRDTLILITVITMMTINDTIKVSIYPHSGGGINENDIFLSKINF